MIYLLSTINSDGTKVITHFTNISFHLLFIKSIKSSFKLLNNGYLIANIPIMLCDSTYFVQFLYPLLLKIKIFIMNG